MAIPNGYTRIEANKLYENVEYYIDTSASINYVTIDSNTSQYPYLGDTGGTSFGVIDANDLILVADWDNDRWYTDNIVDGVVTGYPTLNINLTTSPDWLYVKSSDKKLVPLYEGDEIQDEIVGTDVTSNGTYEYTPETGFVATKKVSLKVAVPQLDTSDATATASDMLNGVSAYVNGVKVTGNIQTYTPSQEVVENGTLAVKDKYVNNDIVVNVQPTLKENYEFVANGEYPVPEGFDGYGTVKVNVPNVNPYTASSESEFNTYLAEENVGNIVKYTGETTETLKKDRLYLIKQVEGKEITFTVSVDGEVQATFKAESGMTRGEWCDTEYNTYNFAADSNGVYQGSWTSYDITESTVIEDGVNYDFFIASGGGAN